MIVSLYCMSLHRGMVMGSHLPWCGRESRSDMRDDCIWAPTPSWKRLKENGQDGQDGEIRVGKSQLECYLLSYRNEIANYRLYSDLPAVQQPQLFIKLLKISIHSRSCSPGAEGTRKHLE
uniref:Uncharacterized protein n=1 Tax=Strigamia maritima TaxID=126957 RepID=T1IVK4_STRMM